MSSMKDSDSGNEKGRLKLHSLHLSSDSPPPLTSDSQVGDYVFHVSERENLITGTVMFINPDFAVLKLDKDLCVPTNYSKSKTFRYLMT